jgi:hypothetical protein
VTCKFCSCQILFFLSLVHLFPCLYLTYSTYSVVFQKPTSSSYLSKPIPPLPFQTYIFPFSFPLFCQFIYCPQYLSNSFLLPVKLTCVHILQEYLYSTSCRSYILYIATSVQLSSQLLVQSYLFLVYLSNPWLAGPINPLLSNPLYPLSSQPLYAPH